MCCSCWWARCWSLPCTAASPSWKPARCATRTRSTRSCKILVDFAISTVAYFFVGYTIAYGVTLLPQRGRRSAAARQGYDAQGLHPRALLLPVHLRRGGAGHRLGRHRRARQVPAAVRGHRPDRRPVLSRSSRASSGTRTSACRRLLQSPAGRRVPRLRRVDRRARRRRLDRLFAPCACWGRASDAMRPRAWSASRRRRSRGWPWAPGCCASAGSAST